MLAIQKSGKVMTFVFGITNTDTQRKRGPIKFWGKGNGDGQLKQRVPRGGWLGEGPVMLSCVYIKEDQF